MGCVHSTLSDSVEKGSQTASSQAPPFSAVLPSVQEAGGNASTINTNVAHTTTTHTTITSTTNTHTADPPFSHPPPPPPSAPAAAPPPPPPPPPHPRRPSKLTFPRDATATPTADDAPRRPMTAPAPAYAVASVEEERQSLSVTMPVAAGKRRGRPCLALQTAGGPVENVSEILEYLLCGGEACSKNWSMLRDKNVKVVVNATADEWVDKLDGVRYLQLGWKDEPTQSIVADLDAALECIEHARSSNSACLVYCKSGMSRSGSVVLAYLVRHRDMSLLEALAFCRARRPFISPNSGFMAQLAEVEKLCRGKVTVDLAKYDENRFGEPYLLACPA